MMGDATYLVSGYLLQAPLYHSLNASLLSLAKLCLAKLSPSDKTLAFRK